MKIKKLWAIISISFAISHFGIVGFSRAEESEKSGPLFIKAFGGLSLLRDADFESSGSVSLPEGEGSFDTGMNIGLAIGYNLIEELAVELEYSYRSNDIKEIANESGQFASSGDLASVAIMANAVYYPKISNSFRPYIGGGVGILQEIDADIKFSNNESVRDLEDSTLALQVIAGVEIPIVESISVLGEGRYLAAPGPDLSNDTQSYDLDYNAFSLNLGVKYSF